MVLVATLLAFTLQTTSVDTGGQTAWRDAAIHQQAAVIQDQKLAKDGDVRAMREYGLRLWQGRDVKRDREAALGWFYEAAIRNDAPSMYLLGRAFERGEGVGKDLKLADYWTARAFENGYTEDGGR